MNKLINGIVELLNSPSGVFSLICLAAISVITYHIPTMGSAAFCAFFAVVPAVLAMVEHREQMAQLNLVQSQASPAILNQSIKKQL